MNPLLYMLSGATALAVAYGVYWTAREFLSAGKSLTRAMSGIADLIESNKKMQAGLHDTADQLRKLASELEFLRTAMIGGSPNFGPENPEAPAAPRKPMVPFPGAPPMFVPVPDAEESDTQVIDTTDEEHVQQEQLEEIRGQGFEAEPEGNPPGVVRNV
jgi:hypothetical protein